MDHDLDNELQRVVGGLRCIDVLEHLPDYLDGSLSPDEVGRVEDHLAGCANCARFGGLYGRAVGAMRALSAKATHAAASQAGSHPESEPTV